MAWSGKNATLWRKCRMRAFEELKRRHENEFAKIFQEELDHIGYVSERRSVHSEANWRARKASDAG